MNVRLSTTRGSTPLCVDKGAQQRARKTVAMSSALQIGRKVARSYPAVILFCMGTATVAQDHYIDLGANVHFILGTILAWIWGRIFGNAIGILSALACAAWTIRLWEHPYGAISTGLEMPMVLGLAMLAGMRRSEFALFFSRRPISILLYWLLFGMPLVFLTYHYLLSLPINAALAIALKQAVNGAANMYLAEGVVLLLIVFSKHFRQLQKRKLSTGALLIYGCGLIVAFSVYYFIWLSSTKAELSQNSAQLFKLYHATNIFEARLSEIDRAGQHAIAMAAIGADSVENSDVVAVLENTAEQGWFAKTSFTHMAEIVAALGSGARLVSVGSALYSITVRDSMAAVRLIETVDDVQFLILTEQEGQLLLDKSSELKTSGTQGRLYRRALGAESSTMKETLLSKDWLMTRLRAEPEKVLVSYLPSSQLVKTSWSFQLELMSAVAAYMIAALSMFTVFGNRLTAQLSFIKEEIDLPGIHGPQLTKNAPFLTVETLNTLYALRAARAVLDQAYNEAVLESRALVQLTNQVHVLLIRIVGGKVVLRNERYGHEFQDGYESEIISQLVSKNQCEPGRWRFDLPIKIEESTRVISWDITCTDEVRGAFTATGTDVTEQNERLIKAAHESKLASMGTLAAGIAHEINQPLNVIAMANENLARTLRRLGLDPAVLDKTATIKQQVHRASTFVQNLRRLAKQGENVSSGTYSFALSETLSAIIELLRPQYALEGIQLDGEVARGLYARGTESLFNQVIINLLTNARDALSAKEDKNLARRISVRAWSEDERILIEVSDDGGGIPETSLLRIFDPFFTTKETGSGLGLALSRQILEAMLGGITATNTDVGAKFLVNLTISDQMGGRRKGST